MDTLLTILARSIKRNYSFEDDDVEPWLSVAREVESVVEKALVRASRLRQSILKNAFEGKLVNGL